MLIVDIVFVEKFTSFEQGYSHQKCICFHISSDYHLSSLLFWLANLSIDSFILMQDGKLVFFSRDS